MAVIKKWRLKKKYALLTIILSAVVLFTLVLGMSYAFFTTRVTSKELVIYTGSLRVEFNNNGNGINLNGTKPMTNTEGLSTDGYTFNIKNTGTIKARYQVRIELENDNEIPLEYIKMSYMQTIQENNVTDEPANDPILLSNLNKSLVFIQNEKIDALKEDSFNLKLWLDISTPNDMQGKTFRAKIIVDAIQDVDEGYVFTSIPVIHLNPDANGNIHMNLKLNDTFTDPGVASVKDDKDNLGVQSINVEYEYFDGQNFSSTNSVDTSTAGVYYIVYTVTDSDNQTGTAIRIVTVNNTNQTPTITLKGTDPYNVSQNSTYVDPGVNIETGNRAIAIGDVNTNAIGQYIVRYIVIDQYGNMNSITRTVNIVKSFKSKLLANNTLITASPNLNVAYNTSDASGLYAMDVTNGFGGSDGTTYYFRGNVTNNYVSFANKLWRIVRINEDGTIRLILEDSMNDTYAFNPAVRGYENMYYSNSLDIKSAIETWYTNNITGTDATKVATGNYFCEAAKYYDSVSTQLGNVGNTSMSSPNAPDLKCEIDGNEKGIVNSAIGLITRDESILAGSVYRGSSTTYYLKKDYTFITMSPAGVASSNNYAYVWEINTNGGSYAHAIYVAASVRPVINLVSTVQATGTGTQADPYVIQ